MSCALEAAMKKNSDTPTDAELMRGICQQEAGAFEALAERYGAALRGHLAAVVRDPAGAEDLLQDLYLRVWTRADQWDGRGSVKAWLFRIATNLALNYLRARRRRREQPLTLASSADEEERPLPAALLDGAGLEAQAVRSERTAHLRGLIEGLPPDKRAVLRLVHEREMAVGAVAEVLGIPEGTVKSRLYHARKQLARAWREFEEEDGED